jgi:hypothetical protein
MPAMADTATHFQNPDRNLALELVRATEAAAIRAVPFIGRGDKNGADAAAVDAMRTFLATVEFDGVIVIGEGEKDGPPCCSTASTSAPVADRPPTSRSTRSTERRSPPPVVRTPSR